MINVKVIADHQYVDYGNKQHRITTFELEYPRFIHSELLTHRVFSRNSASSRAIPLDRMIDLVIENPVIPKWTLNQKGMTGLEVTNDITKAQAMAIWVDARDNAVKYVNKLKELGIHKQNANRLLEPFQHIKTILTGTDFDNFFKLRISAEAQPEIKELAVKMRNAMNEHIPSVLGTNHIHCPYMLDPVDKGDIRTVLTSVALCAQVSYRREDSKEETVSRIINRLLKSNNVHASPFEHICMIRSAIAEQKGNLNGFIQLRHIVEQFKKLNKADDYYIALVEYGDKLWDDFTSLL